MMPEGAPEALVRSASGGEEASLSLLAVAGDP